MSDVTSHCCYTDEWKRSNPDLVVYLPQGADSPDADGEHFLVFFTPGGDMMASWTQGQYEGAPNQHVVYARSADNGATWTAPHEIDGPGVDAGRIASWAFPLVSRVERIYCLYNKHTGTVDLHPQFTGVMRCQYSDDDGRSWQFGGDLSFRRQPVDHPDPGVPPNWIAWQKPIRDSRDRLVVGFTRWTSPALAPEGGADWCGGSQIELMRFDNIDQQPAPDDIQITWLPQEGAITVPHARYPDLSAAQEPSLVLMPDSRLFMVIRTMTGRIWYTVSDDDGESWRQPEVLRCTDEGEGILQPLAPCPIYPLADGRYILLYHNNDGTAHSGEGPAQGWNQNRWPAFIALGEFRAGARQPIWFSPPRELVTTNGVGVGPKMRTEIATYTSFTERNGRRILWYPDRKHFLLGKYITDEWLSGMVVPKQ